MQQTLALTNLVILASVLMACAAPSDDDDGNNTVTARQSDEFWSHRFSIGHDVPYGDDPQQKLDLYLQGSWVGEPTFFDHAAEPRPTLLFIHGGGWVVHDRRPEPIVYPFVQRGWHVISMTYRVGTGTAPAAIDDAVCALNWIVENAEQFNFDRNRIVVAGISAGGHLALTTGTLGSRAGHDCYPGDGFEVHAVINWFGITDIEAVATFLDSQDHWFGNYAREWIGDDSRLGEISAAYSPVHLIHADSPPVLTIHGTSDTVVPFDQAEALHNRLDELGVHNELLPLQGGTHAGFTDAQYQEAFARMLAFVNADDI